VLLQCSSTRLAAACSRMHARMHTCSTREIVTENLGTAARTSSGALNGLFMVTL
jgi:hypothetical protein